SKRPVVTGLCELFSAISVLAPAVGVDFVDQGRHRLGRGKLRNAMPEIEHVASVADWPKVVDDPTCLGTNGCLATEQGHGIDIALQGDLVFDPAASLGKVGSPVQIGRAPWRGRAR